MTTSKELNQAFMPTSNDSLHSASNPMPFDEFAVSTSPQASEMRSEFGPQTLLGTRLQWQPPNRDQVGTSSALPTSANDGPDSTDETFWYSLHLETLKNFERERSTWTKMTDRLGHDIEKLKEELAAARSKSRTDSAFYSQTSKENDKVFFNPDTVNRANEKLREFSVVSPGFSPQILSPRVEKENPFGTPPDAGTDARGIAGRSRSGTSSRLPSIMEDAGKPRTPKRVSISEPNRDIDAESEVDVVIEEPISPPTTAMPMSPPPAEYVMNAGHTPARISGRSSFVEPNRKVNTKHLVAQRSKTLALDGSGSGQGELDDDPELKSPKLLPTNPAADFGLLSALSDKLKEVAENPEGNTPEVVKNDLTYAGEGEDEAVPEIKLKTNGSMNFGTQLGKLK